MSIFCIDQFDNGPVYGTLFIRTQTRTYMSQNESEPPPTPQAQITTDISPIAMHAMRVIEAFLTDMFKSPAWLSQASISIGDPIREHHGAKCYVKVKAFFYYADMPEHRGAHLKAPYPPSIEAVVSFETDTQRSHRWKLLSIDPRIEGIEIPTGQTNWTGQLWACDLFVRHRPAGACLCPENHGKVTWMLNPPREDD